MDAEKSGARRTLKLVSICLGSLLALENIWIGRSGVLEANPIEDTQAQIFLAKNYFPAAIRNPETAMASWGTPDFQALKKAKGLENYRKWYRPVAKIPANEVTLERVANSTDTFTVSIKRRLKRGGSDRRSIVMRVRCADFWQARVPWLTCTSENLRVDYTRSFKGSAD